MKFRLMLAAALSAVSLCAQSAPKITTPQEALGFNLGDDYMVANYTQLEAYWKKLATESDRMKLVSIGKTEEGRDQCMAIISSPENIKNLDHYKQISARLAHAEGVTRGTGAPTGRAKARPWSGSTADCTPANRWARSSSWKWSTRWSAAPIPRPCVSSTTTSALCVQANPDGQELIANWYMRGSEKPDAPLQAPAAAQHGQSAAALGQVHRPRRQSRLLHVQHEGNHQHEPPIVPRMVSADHVQPPPDRAGRRGDLHAAFPRSVQLQFRSAGAAGDRNGGHRHAQPAGGRRQGRQRHAQRRPITPPGGTADCAPSPTSTT